MIKLKKSEFIFYMAWILYLSSYIFLIQSELAFSYNTQNLFTFIRGLTCILLMTSICINRYTIKELCIICLMFGIVLINLIYIRKLSFFIMMLFIMAFKGVNFDKFIKVDLILRVLLLLLVITLCYMGIIDNFKININGIDKQALGFSHPNTLGLFVFIILLEYIYLKFENIGLKEYFYIFSIEIILYSIGTSRTGLLLTIITITLVILFKKNIIINNNRLIKNIIICFPVIVCSICYGMASMYDSASLIWKQIDSVMTTRIHWANYYLDTYNVKLFGNYISPISARTAKISGLTSSNSLDMGYVRIGVQYGIIILIMFVSIQILIQNYAVKEKNWRLLICNCVFIMVGILENLVFSITMNFTLLIFLYSISNIKKLDLHSIKENNV